MAKQSKKGQKPLVRQNQESLGWIMDAENIGRAIQEEARRMEMEKRKATKSAKLGRQISDHLAPV